MAPRSAVALVGDDGAPSTLPRLKERPSMQLFLGFVAGVSVCQVVGWYCCRRLVMAKAKLVESR